MEARLCRNPYPEEVGSILTRLRKFQISRIVDSDNPLQEDLIVDDEDGLVFWGVSDDGCWSIEEAIFTGPTCEICCQTNCTAIVPDA